MNKDRHTTEGESATSRIGNTRMRTPFTADTPDEFGEAGWLPKPKSLPDESNDEWPLPLSELDPLGLMGTRTTKR